MDCHELKKEYRKMDTLHDHIKEAEEALGATNEGFRSWMRLENGINVHVDDLSFPNIKELFWPEYIDAIYWARKQEKSNY